MATTIYTIIVQNDHGQPGNYAAFVSPPTVSASGTNPQVYTNAWITQYVATGGNMTITTGVDYYAWAGTTTQAPAPGVSLATGTSQIAQLGTTTSPGSTFPMTVVEGTPILGTPTLTAKPGAFEIDTDDSFTSPNNTYMIGLGKVNGFGIVSPVGSILADNNTATTITPIAKFYVGTSSFQAGQIVDFQSVSQTCGLVDFSSGGGLGMLTAVVHHGADGSFNTQYFPSAGAVQVMQAVKENNLRGFLSGKPDVKDKKLRELQTLVKNISDLLGNVDPGSSTPETLDSYEWIGLVQWPVVATIGVVTTGVGLIVGYLIANKYQVTYETTKNADGTTTVKFKFGPSSFKAEFKSSNVLQIWNSAVNADTQHDGHINEGLTQTSYGSEDLTDSDSRKLLMQLRDTLDRGSSEIYTNGNHKGAF